MCSQWLAWSTTILCLASGVRGGGSFVDITGRWGLNNVAGTVGAMGDWNSDHSPDLFVAHNDVVTVYQGAGDDKLVSFNLSAADCSGCQVVNMIAGDMNHDGRLDVVVQATRGTGPLHNSIFIQTSATTTTAVMLPESGDHFLALNMFGSLAIDLVTKMEFGGRQGVTAILQNKGCDGAACEPSFTCYFDSSETNPQQSVPGCSEIESFDKIGLASAGSSTLGPDSATVDLDGDCSADVVLSFQQTSGHLTNSNRVLRLLRTVPTDPYFQAFPDPQGEVHVAKEVGFISWKDVDSDGDMDMVAPYCSKGSCTTAEGLPTYDSIISILNSQPNPGCSGYDCCFARPFGFPAISSRESIEKAILASAIIKTSLVSSLVATVGKPGRYGEGITYPPVLRLSDVNNDRSPDVIVTLQVGASVEDRQAQLWRNTGSGSFYKSNDGSADSVMNIKSPDTGFFFDLNTDGSSDILLLVSQPQPRIYGFQNDIHETNHLFFQALGLNGKCSHSCKTHPRNPKPKPYGVNMPGVTHKIFFKIPKTMSSKNIYMTAVQLTQSQYLSLQPPYSHFGMGSTNSYIETYFCGYHLAGHPKNHQSWVALLPNSKVIVFNYPPEHPKDWTIELLIEPSRLVAWIVIMAIVSLLLLCIPIIYLRLGELKEDAEERKRDRPLMPM